MKAATSNVNFPELERELLAAWERDKTFQKSLERNRASGKEFTFYDGPPFANGLPHYGHLLANTIKDSVPRYWTMRGFYVERRFGWDCHGLPVEYEIEKRDGLRGRTDILAMGVAKFNEACRASVLAYTKEWEKTITRLGRWVDWQNQYRTMDKDFMESVWWVVAELYRKGLVYRDFKVVPYSPRITAVLSNFEANQNYKDVQDPAISVKFKLQDEDAYLLAWTTTPWTLISNLALCVGPEVPYVKVRDSETKEVYYLAESRLDHFYKKRKDGSLGYEKLESVTATNLAGRRYEPLFPYFKGKPNAFQVLVDAYVSTEEGTGIVHQAPAYGEDDFRICRAHKIELVDPVDEEGKFKTEIAEHAGVFVKDADKDITKRLKDMGRLFKQETVFHSYPFCDRTDSPLIYKAIRTWYVGVERLKEKLVANNQKINWVPEHLRDGRMGKWLEGARDWAISRNRFWGTPIPIWACDKDDAHLEVIGRVADLEAKSGQKVTDLHSHYVDALTFKCTAGGCGGTMKRVPEVLDCWFESGSMPYAQIHYPMENKDRFAQRFPADFIAEGLDQTRGWFYTLSVLSTALFDQPAFKNVIVNGLVLDAEGKKKLSKRLKNYTPPDELLDRAGADSVRLYMLNSPVLKAGDLRFSDQGVRDTTRAVLLPLWNAYAFLTTYAAADGWQPDAALAKGHAPTVDGELDRWIVSRFQTLCQRVHEEMEGYRLYNVVPQVLDFIEDLTNWFIRLSRKRFWGTDEDEDAEAGAGAGPQSGGAKGASLPAETREGYATLYYVMTGFAKVFAPFAPFVAEKIYLGLTEGVAGVPKSVHLCDMPLPDNKLVDRELEERMSLLRRAANLGRSLRAKHKLRTRQPLPRMTIITRRAGDADAVRRGEAVLMRELNVKTIEFTTDETKWVTLSLKPNLKTLGKRLGQGLVPFRQALEKAVATDPGFAAKLLAELESMGKATVAGAEITEDDLLIDRGPKDGGLIATESGITVVLDTRLTDELVLEGLSREVVNRVQRLRKDSGLVVTDRIDLEVRGSGKLAQAAKTFSDFIARETLATKIAVVEGGDGAGASTKKHAGTFDIEGTACTIGLSVL
jgi:isoleucyl-tRNA synthetase